MSKINQIIIFGCGSAGANTLLNLVAMYPDFNYTIVDYDVVEQRNLIVQPYEKSDLNRPKTQALQRILSQKFNKKINILNKKIVNKSELVQFNNSLLIDAFDNVQSRNLFIGLKNSVLHIGFSQLLTGECAWDDVWRPMTQSKSDTKVDVCLMHQAKAFINSLAGISALVISKFIEKQEKINVYFDSNLILKIF